MTNANKVILRCLGKNNKYESCPMCGTENDIVFRKNEEGKYYCNYCGYIKGTKIKGDRK